VAAAPPLSPAEAAAAAARRVRAAALSPAERRTERGLQLTAAVWAVALLCLACWTGLRKRRLYDLPCHIVPLPAQRGALRSTLLVISTALLALELLVFQQLLIFVVTDACTITTTAWVPADWDKGLASLMTILAIILLLAYRVPAIALSFVRWLLPQAGMTVLQTAVRYNRPWFVGLTISPRTAVTDYYRTRPAVFGTVAAIFSLDKAATEVINVLELQHIVNYLRIGKVISCNSEATLIDFAVVNAACEKGWDAAVVLRLLHAWMQSPQCNAADVLATVAKSSDYIAVCAILQMYALCDTRHPDCVSNYSAASTANSVSLPERFVVWLENCVIAVCELHAVTDRCHLADETQVLTAVAAVSTALKLRGPNSQKRRKALVQKYTELRRIAAQAHIVAVTPPRRSDTIMQYSNGSVTGLWRCLLKVCKHSRPAAAANCERSTMADTCASDMQDTCASDMQYEQRVVDSRSADTRSTETSLVEAGSTTADSTAALQHQHSEQCSECRHADDRVQQFEQQLSSERSSHKLALSKRDAEHATALQQCRDDAAAAAAAAATKLKAVTEQFEELEERSVCVVCQHDPKQVLLQPCLHLCLCVKCSKSPKITECPLCRAAIDYRETVHLC
jgi:Zinc finger, C3HC4 type (RING finger)